MTNYQRKVNDLTGAMGPTTPAFWKNDVNIKGDPWKLSSQPLSYNTMLGIYETAQDQSAYLDSMDPLSVPRSYVSYGFGKHKKRSLSKKKKSRSSLKNKKRVGKNHKIIFSKRSKKSKGFKKSK